MELASIRHYAPERSVRPTAVRFPHARHGADASAASCCSCRGEAARARGQAPQRQADRRIRGARGGVRRRRRRRQGRQALGDPRRDPEAGRAGSRGHDLRRRWARRARSRPRLAPSPQEAEQGAQRPARRLERRPRARHRGAEGASDDWVHKVGPEANHDCAKCGTEVVEKSAYFAKGKRCGVGCPDCGRARLRGRPHACRPRHSSPWNAFA